MAKRRSGAVGAVNTLLADTSGYENGLERATAAIEKFDQHVGESNGRTEPAAEDPGFESPEERKAADPAATPAAPLCTAFVSIMMPAAIGPEGEHQSDHLELRLFGKQVEALHRLWKGCQRENVYLASGGRVVNRADVVRLLLERAAEQMGV